MKSAILASFVASAAAFVPTKGGTRTLLATNAAIDDLKIIAEKSNPVLKVCCCALKAVTSVLLEYNGLLPLSAAFVVLVLRPIGAVHDHYLGRKQWRDYQFLATRWD